MMRRRRSVILSSLAVSVVVHALLLFFFAYPIVEIKSLRRLVASTGEDDLAVESAGSTKRRRENEECTMCSALPGLCEEVGEFKMNRAVSYEGSNDRLRRFLAKVKSGQPFTVGVIGGSVSQGHGVPWGYENDVPREPAYRPQNMQRIIFEHLHSLSPLSAADTVPFNSSVLTGGVGSATGDKVSFHESGKSKGQNTFINGAQGGTGSGYFAYCWGEHLDMDTDLFLIELSINDEKMVPRIESYELMIRSLMDLPHKPAVINIEVFQLLFDSISAGGEMHKGVNEFYDIPSVSLRNAFLDTVLEDVNNVERFFRRDSGEPGYFEGMDLRHLSHLGHRLTAELVNAYINKQLCQMEKQRPDALAPWPSTEKELALAYPVHDPPKMRLNTKYDRFATVPPLRPQCFTMKDTKNKKLEPVSQTGWKTWSWKNQKHYWISTEPGATITFGFTTAIGQVQIHYLRSKIFGLGNVWCWVDDDKEDGKRIEGWWHLGFNIDQSTSFEGLAPGQHLLHCENEVHSADPGGGHEFRITSLTSI